MSYLCRSTCEQLVNWVELTTVDFPAEGGRQIDVYSSGYSHIYPLMGIIFYRYRQIVDFVYVFLQREN